MPQPAQRRSAAAPRRRRGLPGRHRRGLSAIELIIGLAITGVIAIALAGLSAGAAAGWRHSGDETRVRNLGAGGARQVADAIADAICVVQVRPGDAAGASAYAFLWQRDNYTAAPDGQAQLGEMALLEYDPATKGVYLYEVTPLGQTNGHDAPSTADADLKTKKAKKKEKVDAGEYFVSSDTVWDGSAPATVAYFKSADAGLVSPRRPIIGGGTTADGGIEVTAAQFARFAAAAGRPVFGFQLAVRQSGRVATSFGNVALRAARTPTNQD